MGATGEALRYSRQSTYSGDRNNNSGQATGGEMSNYPKGSEWRRWDLHVHTPETALNNQFGDDWKTYLCAIEAEPDVKIVGITDYFTIDNYSKVRDFKNKSDRIGNVELIIPNIEFRLAHSNGGSDVNIHLLVNSSQRDHENEINSALARLSYPSAGGPISCTRNGLIKFGRTRLNGNPSDAQALEEGCKQFRPSFDKFIEWLESEDWLHNNSLLALPGGDDGASVFLKRDGSWDDFYEKVLQKIDIIFSGQPNDRRFWLGQKHEPSDPKYKGYIDELNKVGGFKPCVHGSDAHEISKLFKPDEERFCWIKADPTFEGLRQIIREPEDRVFIGERPPKLKQDESNPTKIIDFVKIAPVNPTGNDGWFDNNELRFNSELVAIIGNKGSGKSALADILALVGNSRCAPEDYSFLRPNKFRKSGLAEKFEAELTWRDGNQNNIKLHKDNDAEVEQVIYLPQSKLEKICAEPNSDSFQSELERVIFSRLDESQKSGHETFQELVKQRDTGHREKIEALRRQISAVNKKVVEYEYYLSDDYRTYIERNLAERKREFEAHKTNEPQEVSPPPPDEVTTEAQDEVEQKSKELEELRVRITSLRKEGAEVESQITITKNLIKRLQNFAESFSRLETETAENFSEIGVVFDSVIKLEHTPKPLKIKLKELEVRKGEIVKQLDESQDNNLLCKEKDLQNELEKLQTSLDKPAQDYQKYLTAMQGWKKKKLEIEGEGDEPVAGTIKNLEQWLDYIEDGVPEVLNDRKENRRNLALDILTELKAIIDDRNELYGPVKDMISRQKVVKDGFGFGFDSQINDKGFTDRFLEYINKGASGSFYGIDESKELLSGLMNSIDFCDAEQVMGLLEKIDHYLHHDMRFDKDQSSISVAGQLKKGTTIEELYDFIWSLDYLEAELALKLDEKLIDQLSPGERGSLLLMFYLLLDESRIPIIIDQPEENLDNQTVYNLLVPIIKQAKQQRQVIMVTHNPNIAVVCDAEQIIHSDIDKAANNKVDYTSGAIESPDLNKHLVDVLEGTKPAFDNRREKYIEK